MTYPFTPVIFQTGRGYRLAITCLRDVAKAMSMSWPDKEHPSFRRAASLVEHAQAGWCTPHAAFEAFVQAARDQRRIIEPRRKLRDRVERELAAIEPEAMRWGTEPQSRRKPLRQPQSQASASSPPGHARPAGNAGAK